MKDKNSKTCDGCEGNCCKYVAIEIDTPKSRKDFEDIKWYVIHKNIQVYVEEDGTWNIEFLTPCEYLDGNNQCEIYETRPKICREYDYEECTFHNEYEEKHTFRTLEDINNFIEKKFSKK